MSRRPTRTPRERTFRVAYNPRPFAGEAYEAELIALREVLPSATAPVALKDGRSITVATVLPMGWGWMVRKDGGIVLGVQTGTRSGDVNIDLGHALGAALAAEPGSGYTDHGEPGAASVGFTDLVAPEPWEVTVHPGFDWWLAGEARDELDAEVQESLSKADAQVVPTERLTSVEAAYWCRINDRSHLRWVFTGDEEKLLDALARLHANGGLAVGEGTRFIGTFRTLGTIVPVWDLQEGSSASDAEDGAVAFRTRLDKALQGSTLSSEERRARAGVLSRQLTLR